VLSLSTLPRGSALRARSFCQSGDEPPGVIDLPGTARASCKNYPARKRLSCPHRGQNQTNFDLPNSGKKTTK